jgi:hypothetical protein
MGSFQSLMNSKLYFITLVDMMWEITLTAATAAVSVIVWIGKN